MKFEKGDRVQLQTNASKTGVIYKIDVKHADKQFYKVFWNGEEITVHREDELSIISNILDPEDNLLKLNLAGYREFQKLLTFKRLDKEVPLRNNIYAYNASKTKFYPYQFKPLIKFLDSPKNRIIICDEVGLGKTIEAGMILTELRARSNMQKVLVVCPANLTSKWKIELKTRFSEDFEIIKKKKFISYLDEIQDYPNQKLDAIISIESIRNDEIILRLKEQMPDFDLVIIDEAHKLRNKTTNQWEIGKTISNLSQSMVMLTATPIHLGIENLFNLLNILDDDDFSEFYSANERFEENKPIVKAQMCLSQFPPNYIDAEKYLKEIKANSFVNQNPLYPKIINKLSSIKSQKINDIETLINLQRELSDLNLISHIYTRTRKREAHTNVAIREAIAHKVDFSEAEKEFYDAVTNYVKSSINIENKGFVQWLLNMPQRRMSSSIPVMVDYYKTNIEHPINDIPESLSEDFSFKNEKKTYKDLQQILNNWDNNFVDSKYNKFIEIINKEKKEIGKVKILVFAFFKGTLRYLEKRLTYEGIKCLRIDGSVPIDTRLNHIEFFKDDETIEILLSSIVGGEGLDFQFCNTIFNYDLPWNPMEMEQRIGRIDRIGQKSKKLHIHNLFIKDSIEERILERLYSRIEIFKHSIGDLEPIIGEIISSLNKLVFSREYTLEEEKRNIHEWELAAQRQIREFQEIEQNSAQFIGTDKFFEIEIENIKRQRRYVTGEQLRIFILDFISNYCPQSRIEYEFEENVGFIFPDEQLKWIIREEQKSSELHIFFTRNNKVKITFDSDVAFENPSIEFINILHPLVSIIINKYKLKQVTFPNAYHIQLKTSYVKTGFYLFIVWRLNIIGAKNHSTLETVIINVDMEEACSRFDAEAILGEMIELGKNPSEEIEADGDWLSLAFNKGRSIFMNRSDEILQENKQRNENFINIRLRSLKLSYNKSKNWVNDQLVKTDKDFRIKMLHAQLEKKTNIFEEKSLKLESKRTIQKNHSIVSAGILEVE
jgi:SNF2 family DNA or RNA helicase